MPVTLQLQNELALQSLDLYVEHASEKDAVQWDELVDRHPEGRFCQLWGFRRALEQAYGYTCAYARIVSSGTCVGVFPSIVLRRGSGRLISQPFNEYGGPLLQGIPSDLYGGVAKLLLISLAEKYQCSSIEIRGGVGCESLTETPFCKRHHLHSFATLQLAPEDVLWRKSLTHEARKSIKQAQKAGLGIEILRGRHAIEQPFYDLYLASMKRLGVPPHPPEFFTSLAEGIGERLVSACVVRASRRIAFLLGAFTSTRLQIYIIASAADVWALRPNDFAHWELIKWAAANGVRTFDFGSARYAGQIQYKKKWGAALHDYHYYLIGDPESRALQEIQTVKTTSTLMNVASTAWHYTVPLGLTPLLGKRIRKYLTK